MNREIASGPGPHSHANEEQAAPRSGLSSLKPPIPGLDGMAHIRIEPARGPEPERAVLEAGIAGAGPIATATATFENIKVRGEDREKAWEALAEAVHAYVLPKVEGMKRPAVLWRKPPTMEIRDDYREGTRFVVAYVRIAVVDLPELPHVG